MVILGNNKYIINQMNFRKKINIFAVMLMAFCLTSCERNKSSMEEQAWREATTYTDWFSKQNDADLKPGVYCEDRVTKNSDLNYTCCVAVTTSNGEYDQWYIAVEKKNDGNWDVISVD